MRSDSNLSSTKSDAPLQPEWRRQVEDWHELLDRCSRKASRKQVHKLRIATLRLQAALENWLEGQRPDTDGMRAAKSWKKHGTRLRRALEPLREADAYLQRLGSLQEAAPGPHGCMLQCSRICLREIEEMESRLKRRRKTAAAELCVEIEDHRKRLDRCSRELEKALEQHPAGGGGSAVAAARQLFARLAGEFPELNGGNLHAYRKRLKKVRYLAETGTDPEAMRLAASSRKMLNAAGDWHDWHVLAKAADRMLPNHGEEDGLVSLLRTMEEDALRRALEICQRHAARLAKSGGAAA
jgi:CHAD domain-containing protein